MKVGFRFLLIILAISCSKPISSKIKECQGYAVKPNEVKSFSENDTIKFYLFVDGTPSMKGFVIKQFSNYYKFLDNTENVIQTISKNVSIDYYKFGKGIYKINRSEFRSSLLNPSFYNDPITYIDIVLDSIIKWGFENKVYLIITDLFQQEGDINKLIEKIRKISDMNVYFGLLLIPSEFKGKVYDVSPKALAFDYEGERPFYLIVLSSDLKYTDKVMNEISKSLKVNSNGIIFGNYFLDNKYSLKVEKNYKGFVRFSDSLIKLTKNEIYMPLKIEFNELHYMPEPNYAKVEVFDCDRKKEVFKNEFDIKNNVLPIKFNLSLIDRAYVINVYLYSDEIPEWILERDMDISNIQDWIKNPKTFEGSKTYNLKKFINALIKVYNLEIKKFSIYAVGG